MMYVSASVNRDASRWRTLLDLENEIKSPSKESTDVTRTLFTHLTNLQEFLLDWQRIKNKGTKLCKTISTLKLHECHNDYYPSPLKELTEGLLTCTDSFQNIVEGVAVINQQLKAIARLQPGEDPIVNTWSAEQISSQVDKLYCSLQKEYKLKLYVRGEEDRICDSVGR